MGLDMYLYKCKHIEPEILKSIKTEEDARSYGFSVYLASDDEEARLVSHLIDAGYAHKRNVLVSYTDEEAIRKDHGIPDDAYICLRHYTDGGSYHNYKWSIDGKEEERTVSLSDEEMETKYIKQKPEDVYLVSAEEVDYWRKYYELENFIYDIVPVPIENCGFYPLSDFQLDEIYRFISEDGGGAIRHANGDDYIIAYHEWY